MGDVQRAGQCEAQATENSTSQDIVAYLLVCLLGVCFSLAHFVLQISVAVCLPNVLLIAVFVHLFLVILAELIAFAKLALHLKRVVGDSLFARVAVSVLLGGVAVVPVIRTWPHGLFVAVHAMNCRRGRILLVGFVRVCRILGHGEELLVVLLHLGFILFLAKLSALQLLHSAQSRLNRLFHIFSKPLKLLVLGISNHEDRSNQQQRPHCCR